MRFGPVPVRAALGGVVAHTLRKGDLVLKKGVVVTAAHIESMAAAGVGEVVVALADAGDLGEDAAALRLAGELAGFGVEIEAPFTGRSNLFSRENGLLVIDADAIDAANMVDEAITIATLQPLKKVGVGEMIATVKIIPFAVQEALVTRAAMLLRDAVHVMPFTKKRVAVISTTLPGLKPSVIDKTLAALDERLQGLALCSAINDLRVPHETSALVAALSEAVLARADIIVVFGASAITDRRDVIPAAVEAAGGRIEHLGMPVDPGNLLLLGELGGAHIIGAPGCARSPRENGFDWVLQRLFADLSVKRDDIQRMGIGGLLMEIFTRPQPRSPAVHANHPQVAAVVLAAGRSSRMGSNKLLEDLRGKPVLRHVVEAVLASRAGPVTVVTGHQATEIALALVGLDVAFVHNPRFAEGMATSLQTGIDAVPDTSAAALVMLGDMPLVTPAILNRLIDNLAGNATARAVVPVADGRRANPVVITRSLFSEVAKLSGDAGARKLLEQAGNDVIEVMIEHDGVLLDVDTPEALARARLAEP
ncbi:MAG: NTP transferase domain-containing protein [Bosea sp. (in: a-proteobacteria)]